MATDTRAHRKIDGALGNGGLCHIAMTCRAGNLGLIMRRMAKPNMCISRETVHALPGNLLLFGRIFDDFFYFWFFTRKLGMAQHAFCDGRNSGIGANVRTRVAINAGQSQLHVGVVRKFYRLGGEGCDAPNCQPYGYPKRL